MTGRPLASVSPIRRARRRPGKSKGAASARLAHQIANQLTVINLTCYKLRTAFKDTAASVDGDIARMENAVAEMNNLVELLRHLEAQCAAADSPEGARPTANPSSLPRNVYPLPQSKKAGD